MRIKTLRVLIFSFLFIIGCHLFYLQIIRGHVYYEQSVNNTIRVVPLEPPRGRILDRNGVVLADNRHSFDVMVLPQNVGDTEEVFAFLAKTLKADKRRLLQNFGARRIAPFSPVLVAEDITKEQAMAIEENRYRYPGVYVEEAYNRFYPFQDVGSHVLGYVGKIDPQELAEKQEYGFSMQSHVGKSGIEAQYDQYLHGEAGGLQMEINSRGRQVRVLGVRQPIAGKDIALTIDQRIQKIAHEGISGRRGAVIVMSLETGEVLSLVSSPAYDPNVFVDRQLKSRAGPLLTDQNFPLLNRATTGQYPPGSVFKLPVAIAGLALNKISPATTYTCRGEFNLGGAKFRCLHVHGPQNLLDAIKHSCNVYFYTLGNRLGAEAMGKYARLLGLGRKTEIDLPFEESGKIPHPRQRAWFGGDTINMSIGQGDVLATPLQLTRMASTLARNGLEIQPYLLKGVDHRDMVTLHSSRHIGMIPQVYDIVNNASRMVVDEAGGTAQLLNIPGMKVAGKTGTAQAGRGRDSHAWFVGYTLDTQPRVAITVFLENGGSSANAVALTQTVLTQMRSEEIF